jgi:hypothetical protein
MVTLCDSLFAGKKNHQYQPVPVTLECKPGTGRPLVKYGGPAHGCPVTFVECILCVNKKESLFVLSLVGLKKETHHMYSTLYAVFKPNTELVHSACFFCLPNGDKKNTLGIEPIPALPVP